MHSSRSEIVRFVAVRQGAGGTPVLSLERHAAVSHTVGASRQSSGAGPARSLAAFGSALSTSSIHARSQLGVGTTGASTSDVNAQARDGACCRGAVRLDGSADGRIAHPPACGEFNVLGVVAVGRGRSAPPVSCVRKVGAACGAGIERSYEGI